MVDEHNQDGDAAHGHDELAFNTTPNYLTGLRVLFVPIVVGMLFVKTHTWDVVAALTFTAASITDYFDGYIARATKQITVFGKLMDPLADKFLVVSSLIMLQYMDRIDPIVVMLLICRELAITGLRALASAEGVVIDASSGGKWKTGTQMTAIPLLMGRELFGIPLYHVGMVLLYISLGLSLWSAKSYVVEFWVGLREQRKQKQQLRRLARAARRKSREDRLKAKLLRKD